MTALERLLAALGNRVTRQHADGRVTARCPAHGDRTPSLSVWLSADGWACLRCHAGCSRTEVLAALGLSLADIGPQRHGCSPFSPRPVETRPTPAPDPAPARAAWKRALDGARRELAAGRGTLLAYLGERLDADAARWLVESGEVGSDVHPGLGACLAIPLRTLNEELRDVHYRALGRRGFARVGGTAGWAVAMVSPSLLLEADGGDLLITEGNLDYLTARVTVGGAVLGLPGAGTAARVGGALVEEVLALRTEGAYGPRRVVIATDADADGDLAARELARVLTPVGIRCLRARPPEGRDVADLYASANNEEVTHA